MKKYKNYEAIYYILKGSRDNQLKELYEVYTGNESESLVGGQFVVTSIQTEIINSTKVKKVYIKQK